MKPKIGFRTTDVKKPFSKIYSKKTLKIAFEKFVVKQIFFRALEILNQKGLTLQQKKIIA